MPRLYLSLFIAFVAFLASGCSLSFNEGERAVSRLNEHIRIVDAASQRVADVIAELPEGDLAAEDFEPLRAALDEYLLGMDGLNAAMRELGDQVEDLSEHIANSFRPSSEAAASSCQQALDALSTEESSEEDIQRAITRIAQCLERYATAVSNVKAAHDRAIL